MSAPINPAASKAFAREKFIFVPTLTNPASPTAAELTGASALDISCYLWEDVNRPTQSTNRVSLMRRLCDSKVFERIGTTQYQGADLVYAVDPQAAALSNGKKAYEKLTAGATGYLVQRDGIDVNTDIAADQFVNVYPVELGPSIPSKVGSGEAAENAMTCTYAITADPKFVVAVA